MKRVAIVALILLAGCSSPDAAPEAPPGTEPLNPNPEGPLPEPVSISDSGDLLGGADAQWDWTIDPRVKAYDVTVTLSGMQGVPVTATTDVAVTLFQNGSHVEDNGGNSGSTGASIAAGTSPATPIFTYTQRISNETLAGQAGTWALTLTAGPNVASYEVTISAIYKV